MTSAIDQLLRLEGTFRRERTRTRAFQGGMMAYAILQSVMVVGLCLNHLGFPLSLDGLELARLDQVQRLLAGQGLYGLPSADAVALVATPLYYYLCAPIVGLFGPSLASLRLVSLLGLGCSGLLLFVALRRKLASHWWATIGLGLFAATYASLDHSLDNAHPDSWLLAMILLGSVLIDLGRSRRRNLLGIGCFVLAFWLKQHGAVFVGAGLVYVTWRQGWRQSWEVWLLVAASAFVYGLGPEFFGPAFHDATWWQPRSWVDFRPATLLRLLGFTARYYPILAIGAVTATGLSLLQSDRPPSIWSFLFPAAVLSGLVGALDSRSSNNIFAPLVLWLIIAGLIGLRTMTQRFAYADRWRLRLVALGLSFGLLFYNPFSVMVSAHASIAYDDLLTTLEQLPSPVYVPALGPLPIANLTVRAPIEAIEGLVRSWPMPPRRNPWVQQLLGPALDRPGAYLLLTNGSSVQPPDRILTPWIDRYQLAVDFGDRFRALRTADRSGRPRWPRYLLRQETPPAAQGIEGNRPRTPVEVFIPAWVPSPKGLSPDSVVPQQLGQTDR
jgi:Dolichyl-phosphate-mannose-protein mannosyltransferase